MEPGPGDRERLEEAIATQEKLRGTVDDDVIDLTIASLREKLDALGEPGQRRRQATVLFADVEGFTALGEILDAEVVTGIMNEVWARLDAILVAHGGRIDKHIGDAVMALWGSASSQENDPEQAVRAALDLQAALDEYRRESGRDLAMRVGISTGAVVFGTVATTREFTAMGDTVNVASRLESAAPSGGVLISHDTFRHVRGVFDVRQLVPLQVKGKAEALVAYEVLRAKPRSFRMATRGVEGVETHMVGRDAELQRLCDALTQVTAGRHFAAVTVLGEAGVGKSRLLYEFENRVDLSPDEVYFFKARALSTGQTTPYGLFRDLLAGRFGIADSDPPPVVSAKLRAGFAPHLSAEEADLVGHWLGFDLSSTEAVRRMEGAQGFSAVCRAHLAHFLRALASGDTTLIVLEDLHWADTDSLDLLDALASQLESVPVLVVSAARPTLLEQRPRVFNLSGGADMLSLDRLDDDQARALVAEVLQHVDAVPAAITDLIVARADGNPFFVEELIKMLIDDGVIVTGEPGAKWRVQLDRLDAGSVPSTLTGVLEARLDSLAPEQRDALQRASVVGRVFWDAVVAAMRPSRPAYETTEALDVAVARELVYLRQYSALDGQREFIFKHALLRDVAYETVLLRDRQRLHRYAAEWLTEHAGERQAEFLEQIAEHWLLAGEPNAAGELYAGAAARALASARSASAHRNIERAMEIWLLNGTAPRAHAWLCLAEARCRMGHFADADGAVEAALAAQLTPSQEAEALYFASWIASEKGDHATERQLLDRALPTAERVGGAVLARVLLGLALVRADAGELDTAERIARRAHEVARDTPELGRSLTVLAHMYRLQGRHDQTELYLRQVLDLSFATGNLELQCFALGNLGVTSHLRGDMTGSVADYVDAERLYREQWAMIERLDMRGLRALTQANQAQVCLRLDRIDESRAHLAGAVRSALEMDYTATLPTCLIVSAEVLLADGDAPLALVILGAVRSSPTLAENDRQEIQRTLDRIGLDPEFVEAGMRDGAGRDLRTLAREVLARYRGHPA